MRSRKKLLPPVLSLLALSALLLLSLRYHGVAYDDRAETPSPGVARPPFRRFPVNCSAIYQLDPVEVGKSLAMRKQRTPEDTDESLTDLAADCPSFLRARGYDRVCDSEGERAFPLAYSLVVHKDAWMVERLIRAAYSPGNVYCVHYDRKSSAGFAQAVEALADCLPNVFVATRRESVFYASVSRLRADLNCLADLAASPVPWRYAINLCGQDFPLRSNAELVAELAALNGSNMLETSRPSELKRQRFGFRHRLGDASFEYQKLPVRTEERKPPPPRGIEVFVGNAYFVLSREFVAFLHSSPVAKEFLDWSEDTYSPDEHFWATLVRVPGVPGEVPRSAPDITDLMSKTRLVKWHYLEENLYPPCTGEHVRSVCIFGAAEMNWLLNYGHWFANKFDPKVDPVLIQCLEETLEDKRRKHQRENALVCG